MDGEFSLERYHIRVKKVLRNAPVSRLYEEALQNEKDTRIASSGALVARSGARTGRSPLDKRIVEHPESSPNVWWGDINIKLSPESFEINRERAIDFLNTREQLYVFDGYAGWDPKYRLKVRVICARAYHALFMNNMLIRPTADELESFGDPDYVVLNSGQFPANLHTRGMSSKTSIDFSFEEKELVILGTEYAGEMKKGVFTIMHYLMPGKGVLSMHCSANEETSGKDLSLFFGLSGTGKTTLSADPRRRLIGDDEHCWTDDGVFNIEGGCYAKCINLSAEKEPEIYDAIRFGTVLENVVLDPTSKVRYEDGSITENTRASYPIEHIENAKIPCVGKHPDNIIFLTADAFGVLPPVSSLSPEQAMYHFISGYTAKVAGTEMGVTEPQATFSSCFGAAFLVRHPTVYAELLAKKMREHGSKAWLVNTGWTGGAYGVGKRMSLPHTRAIIDAIHDGSLAKVEYRTDPIFQVKVPMTCNGVPAEILDPSKAWSDGKAYHDTAIGLAKRFQNNFKKYEDVASDAIKGAGPKV